MKNDLPRDAVRFPSVNDSIDLHSTGYKRRDFLKIVGATAGAAGLVSVGVSVAPQKAEAFAYEPYFTDDQLFIRESGLYKLATEKVLANPEISRTVRRFDAHIIEVNPTYTIVMKHGITEDIISLYRALDTFGCVLQYTRSGRIAVTRGKQEQVSEFLEQREKEI